MPMMHELIHKANWFFDPGRSAEFPIDVLDALGPEASFADAVQALNLTNKASELALLYQCLAERAAPRRHRGREKLPQTHAQNADYVRLGSRVRLRDHHLGVGGRHGERTAYPASSSPKTRPFVA